MASNQGSNKNTKFDKRLLEWNLNNGQLTKEELKKHLDELPDLSNRIEIMPMNDEERPRREETH